MDATRRPLWQFLASIVFVLLAVTAASVGWVTWTAHAEARQSAGDAAMSFAQTAVSPLRVADLDHSTHLDTRLLLDQAVVGLLADGEAYRVKIWRIEEDGVARIVYSDLRELEGTRVPVNPYLQEALDTGEAVVVPVPGDVAHENEQRPETHALEVYLPFEDAAGMVAVAELYRTAEIGLRIRELLGHTLPVAVGGPILLSALTLPLAMRLARTQAAAEAECRASVEHALAASEKERRRLATLLHDGPVQDLAALGMMLERSAGPAATLDGRDAAERVRAQVGRLRALLDDLDPVEEDDGDLRGSLRAAVASIAGDSARVTIRGSELRELDPARRALLHRCTLELLRNALTHAGPGNVDVHLVADSDRVRVRVEDDGCGFDHAETPGGHHGLSLVRAAIRDAGGTMSVVSDDGGTRIVMEVPCPAEGVG